MAQFEVVKGTIEDPTGVCYLPIIFFFFLRKKKDDSYTEVFEVCDG